ncbi:glycosyltransferase [Janibacter sp. G1551]|uniref:glycosyltransferase n=1 Tax=Janibacter sp. G1551 TaxID=3420440 RepID=UPI003D0336C2
MTAADMTAARSALVVTVVHNPQDSRIRQREITALLAAGWHVTYAAPFSAFDQAVPTGDLTGIDLPRAVGRSRGHAWRAVRRVLREQGSRHDVVLVHDPEILTAAVGLGLDRLIWDVHEDPAGALTVKEWMPRPLRGVGARGWRLAERLAERRWTLLLAEHAYQERFRREHVVVPNTVTVPDHVSEPGSGRVVYLGSVTQARGCASLVEVARSLTERTGGGLTLDVIGPALDADSRRQLTEAQSQGTLRWHGFLPSDEAFALLDGALAGLSLLRDLPNYRGSMPTKVVEYLAHGLPVVSTPLPLAVELLERSGGGVVVPFDDPVAAADAVLDLRADAARARLMGERGHAYVADHYDWSSQAGGFITALTSVADRGTEPPR